MLPTWRVLHAHPLPSLRQPLHWQANAIRKQKCLFCSPFYGRACRWALLGEINTYRTYRTDRDCWEKLTPTGPKGPINYTFDPWVVLGGGLFLMSEVPLYAPGCVVRTPLRRVAPPRAVSLETP